MLSLFFQDLTPQINMVFPDRFRMDQRVHRAGKVLKFCCLCLYLVRKGLLFCKKLFSGPSLHHNSIYVTNKTKTVHF